MILRSIHIWFIASVFRCFLILFIMVMVAQPISARMLTTRPSASKGWSPLMPLVIGGGFEYESDSDKSQCDYPLFMEYNFTEKFKLAIESNFVSITSKTEDVRSVSDFGDLETSVEYEFLRERRYRPALTAEGIIKWPTSGDPDIGTPGKDYSVGLIMSKDLVFVDIDFNVLYTFVGDQESQNALEFSLAANWHLNHYLDVEAEVARVNGTGGVRGQPPGTLAGLAGSNNNVNSAEGTLGLAWHVTKYLKLEVGTTYADDGTWQYITAWEYSFSGED
jgi:hypothetical protein